MEDYYNLFPDCERCTELRLRINLVTNPAEEEIAEGNYARHLVEEHKLNRLEVCDRSGVFIW